MPKHIYEVHDKYTENYCNVCEGGLSICTTCGCIEGSLPTECPGYRCYDSHGDAIYEGYIDFENGVWVLGPSMNSPAYWREEKLAALAKD